MREVSINKNAKLSEHFQLGELCKTSHKTADGNIPSRCVGVEQALRYANILLDIADGTKRDFDELFIERSKQGRYWIHFAVRPKDNRRRISIMRG